MKRLIPTIVLVLICIGGFWYASSQDFFRDRAGEPKSLVAVEQAQVQSILVQSADNTVELQLKDGEWTMSQPSALPLNSYSVQSWISSFSRVASTKTIEEKAADLAVYGLNQPERSYKVTLKDGSSKVILVGTALPIQGYYYVSVENEPAVYQVSEQELQLLDKSPLDFMDTSPVKLDQDQVQSMKVTWKGQSWQLSKADKEQTAAQANWKLGEKELKGTDATQVLNKFAFLYTNELAKPAADVSMDRPELTVELTLSDNGKDTAHVYRGKLEQVERLWLTKQGDSWSYQIAASDIQALADQLVELSK